ncbi:MAG: YeeE/YedE family protein [Gammaproteobacteria bacterium]|nr:YeeE/YedE family protein [Gammaproteobacteria bacterium]
MHNHAISLLLGTLFGFLLAFAGATNFSLHAELFLFENLWLLFVIGSAVATGVTGVYLLKRWQPHALLTQTSIDFSPKGMTPNLVMGAVLFGIGWGMSAACPGTAPTMIGEGKLEGVLLVAGIILGTAAYGKIEQSLR